MQEGTLKEDHGCQAKKTGAFKYGNFKLDIGVKQCILSAKGYKNKVKWGLNIKHVPPLSFVLNIF